MSGPKKGLYDDRPKEDEWNKWTTKLIELTKKLKETPINQLFDYRPIKAILDKLEVLEAKEHKVTSHVIDLKEEQVYNPHGEYSGMDVAKEKDTTVYRYSYGGRVETFDIKDMSIRDIDYWLTRFRKSRIELQGQDIPSNISPRLRQAEIDGMKSIEKELLEKIRGKPRFGVVYEATGTVPLGMTNKDWKQLTNEIKDAHADDPTPRHNDGETDEDLYQEVLTEEALKKELADAEYYKKALSANPHEWPVTTHCGSAGCPGQPKCSAAVPVPSGEATIDHMKCRGGEACGGATQEEKDAFEKDLQERTIEEERRFQKTAGAMPSLAPCGVQPSKPWPRVEQPVVKEMNRIKCETEEFNNGIEQLFRSESGKKAIEKLQEDKEFMNVMQNIVDILRKPEPTDVKDNRTMKLRWQEAIEQLTEELRCLPKEQLFNHPRITEVVNNILSTEEIIVPPMPGTYPSGQARNVAQNANYRKLYGSLPDPKLTIIPHYDAYAALHKKQLKKIRRYKVIAVVSKVITVTLLIYIGLIIMESILADRPIGTFLKRILVGE